MKELILGLILVVTGFTTWALGIGVAASVVASFLKFIGVDFVAQMSYWLPIQLVGYFIVSWLTLVCTMVYTAGGGK